MLKIMSLLTLAGVTLCYKGFNVYGKLSPTPKSHKLRMHFILFFIVLYCGITDTGIMRAV